MQSNYMIFVLGYDLLHNTLSISHLPCDVAMKVCETIYKIFQTSEEYEQNKSEYECLQDYVQNHSKFIKAIIQIVSDV